MGIIVNNIKPIRIMFNGVEATLYHNGIKIWPEDTDPYNPLNLPPNTVRVRTNDGLVPEKRSSTSYETATLVEGTSDVYDVYMIGTDFYNLFYGSINVVEVLGANTTDVTVMENMLAGCSSLMSVSLFDTSSVTNMANMFAGCSSLTSVPLFDTSRVTDMGHMLAGCSSLTSVPLFDTSRVGYMTNMFEDCSSLTSVPLFNTSNVRIMNNTFKNCTKVQSGALALYQQVSTQANQPLTHDQAFRNCGSDTTTGAAELAQIPEDWK